MGIVQIFVQLSDRDDVGVWRIVNELEIPSYLPDLPFGCSITSARDKVPAFCEFDFHRQGGEWWIRTSARQLPVSMIRQKCRLDLVVAETSWVTARRWSLKLMKSNRNLLGELNSNNARLVTVTIRQSHGFHISTAIGAYTTPREKPQFASETENCIKSWKSTLF